MANWLDDVPYEYGQGTDVVEAETPDGYKLSMRMFRMDFDTRRRRKYGYISIDHVGETVLEHLANRRDRSIRFYRKQILPTVLSTFGFPEGVEIRWNQHAGCWCSCSPGFTVKDENFWGLILSVNVDDAPRTAHEVPGVPETAAALIVP